MTAQELTPNDLDTLVTLLAEYHAKGRFRAAIALARVYAATCPMLYPNVFDEDARYDEIDAADAEAEQPNRYVGQG